MIGIFKILKKKNKHTFGKSVAENSKLTAYMFILHQNKC